MERKKKKPTSPSVLARGSRAQNPTALVLPSVVPPTDDCRGSNSVYANQPTVGDNAARSLS